MQLPPLPPPTYGSFYLEIEKQFNPEACRIATTNMVAPFTPRVYVKGDLFETNLYCAPLWISICCETSSTATMGLNVMSSGSNLLLEKQVFLLM